MVKLVFVNKIINYLKRKPASYTEKHSTDSDNSSKIGKYVPGFLPCKIKCAQMFRDNRKLDQEKYFVLNGDASNLRFAGKILAQSGEQVDQWTVDGNKIRLTLFNGITHLKKSQENEIISGTAAFKELEQRGSWVDSRTDFLNVIWGMYIQRKEGAKNAFSFFTRSLRHSKEIHDGMGGTSYKCNLDIEGSLTVKKEIWHTGGYQFSKKYPATDHSIFDKRIGYAVGLYNFLYDDQKRGVCVMQFLDEECDGLWKLEYMRCDRENMGWGKKGEKGGEKFGGKYDQIITWGSPKVTFRWDNSLTWFDSPFAYEFDVTNEMICTARNAPLIEPI
jgi:hypothetical protein